MMKAIQTTAQPTQFPQFWNEDWLQVTIDELDKRKMTPAERFAYERTLAINAEAIQMVNVQVQEARVKARTETQKEAVLRLVRLGKLSILEIAEGVDVLITVIEELQRDHRTVN
ncbi:hypothetical protein J2I47_08095 [Fibrella sp. HMF5335]|uniref:Uncharacterized protein n=1 Tax=Fibrella rubiginis TaxID=2817060 RepID=A0A939GCN2_9BACT|nr:hypothetical protein [Fibrella rubiginis]MBO0936499.1 hypothetical protein [Fibrella rubiginis]